MVSERRTANPWLLGHLRRLCATAFATQQERSVPPPATSAMRVDLSHGRRQRPQLGNLGLFGARRVAALLIVVLR